VPISRRSAVHAAQVQDEPSEGHRMVGQWSRISLSAIAEESSERRWGRPPWGSARLHRRDRANRFAPGTAADRRVHGWTIRGVGAWCGAGVDAPRDAVLLLPDETKWSFIRPAATHPGSYELFWLAAMRSSGNPRARDEDEPVLTRARGLGGIPCDRAVDPAMNVSHGTARVASLRLAWPERDAGVQSGFPDLAVSFGFVPSWCGVRPS
jgi:hypothetical protein